MTPALCAAARARLAAAGDLALTAAAAVFALRLLVLAAYLASMAEGRLGAEGFLLLTAEPLAYAAAAAAALLVRGWPRGSPRRTLAVFALVVLAPALRPAEVRTRTNGFGLASEAANSVREEDYARRADKDGYPPCRFQYNALGYRDEEPSFAPKEGERRVLLVGDSYVWGDGIPANAETLGSLLRAELDRRAPGRFAVMSAAYPGLGLYGYGRFIDALSPLWKPDDVVVGYLGENDHDPFDPQFLLDHLPRNRLLRNLVLNLGAAQRVHDASVRHFSPIWSGAANRDYFAALTREDARKASARGYRLAFLSYFPHPPLPEPIEALDLPPSLRYPGRASDLWYAKDFHPKTALNRLLARTLAAKLAGK